MLSRGTPLHVVSEVLGHASIVITKDVYGHLVEGEKRIAAEAITAALFDEADGSGGRWRTGPGNDGAGAAAHPA